MRQAWLIIAHNEFEVLQHLVSMLDAPGSEFYIHFDKKVPVLPEIRSGQGKVSILEERINVCWGTVSQIEAELLLLRTALKNGPYGHYHILSGTHLPLKDAAELFRFYDSHAGEEVLRLWPRDDGDADFKLRRYHFPVRYFKNTAFPVRRAAGALVWKTLLKFQKLTGIRHLTGCDFQKSDNWMSLTEQACRYLVSHRKEILDKYRWSFCGDEYFAATELLSVPGAFNIFDCPELLYVEFLGDSPRTFRMTDYPELAKTGYYWARKFTSR